MVDSLPILNNNVTFILSYAEDLTSCSKDKTNQKEDLCSLCIRTWQPLLLPWIERNQGGNYPLNQI